MEHLSEELRSYIAGLRRYALSLVGDPADADDLVQEALKRGLTSLDKGSQIDNLRSYLYRILHNVRASQARKAGNGHDHVPIEDVAEMLSSPGNQQDRVELRELLVSIYGLSSEQREVLMLVTVEGFTYREAADVLNVPVGTVMSRLARARSTLVERRRDPTLTGQEEA